MAEEEENKELEPIDKIISEISPYYKKRTELAELGAIPNSASEYHQINYDSSSETLEPLYFWILDFMGGHGKVDKLVDNFTSTPGGGHFSELMAKATRMQEEANKLMQTAGVLIKNIVNIIYDLKDFEIRLSHYKAARASAPEIKEAGVLALKQIWMDNVDMKRGQGSINAMTQGQLNFVTLRDSFMAAKSVKEVDDLDLNDRVKRILKPRLLEFFKWVELSEAELTKRYSIEKTYLKNQLNSLKLQSRWAKPYLQAALKLEQKEAGRNPDLVTAFNSIRLELTLLGKSSIDIEEEIANHNLPEALKGKIKRKYYACVLSDFYFRGVPRKFGQHYVFGGRAEMTFRAYALNEDEIKMLYKKLDESDINDVLKLVSGMTDDSLKELQEDISYFLEEEEKREKISESNSEEEDVNPFAALIGLGNKKEKKEEKKEKEIKAVKKDSYMEESVRAIAESEAQKKCFSLFDIYKKAHGMASRPPLGEEHYGQP